MKGKALAERMIREWVDAAVIALDLCPFSHGPWKSGAVAITPSLARTSSMAMGDVGDAIEALLDSNTIETTLVVFARALDDFEEFLDAVDHVQGYLEESELDQELQLASFHPEYVFEGVATDAASNYTNRAPLPVLQLLRVRSVDEAVSNFGDTSVIPTRNIESVEAMEDVAREMLRTPLGAEIGRGPIRCESRACLVFAMEGVTTSRIYPSGTELSPGPWSVQVRFGEVAGV